jgi:hypothetical protein
MPIPSSGSLKNSSFYKSINRITAETILANAQLPRKHFIADVQACLVEKTTEKTASIDDLQNCNSHLQYTSFYGIFLDFSNKY